MHQDVYNEIFEGEGAPDWAVCTNGVQSTDPPGRWSLEYGTRAAGIAFSHFWHNNVRGDLQGQYDQVWGDVAHAFTNNRWVLGYDPFNEPFSTSLIRLGDEHFDSELECFYTGTAHIGAPSHGAPAAAVPQGRPRPGCGAHHREERPHAPHLRRAGQLRQPGPAHLHRADGLPQPRLQRSHLLRRPQPGDGQPDRRRRLRRPGGALAGSAAVGPPGDGVGRPAGRARLDRHRVRRHQRPPAAGAVTAAFDERQVSWIYWAWKYYGDPTGSADESLVMANGRLRSTADVLSRAYPRRSPASRCASPSRRRPTSSTWRTTQPPRTRADAGLRADAGALPARLLRPHDRAPV